MSRFDGELRASGDASLSISELLAILGGKSGASELQRQQAIACFLSASEGWSDAAKALGGAFASDAAGTGLKDDKSE